MSCRHHAAAVEGHPEFSGFDGGFCRPGLPLKAAALVGATLICPALGFAALAVIAVRSLRHESPDGCGRGRRFRARHFGFNGNSAFDEHRRATMQQLDEEARAFEEFERRQREARDQAEYDRFMSERAAQKPDAVPEQH